jgi:hypothetical protein
VTDAAVDTAGLSPRALARVAGVLYLIPATPFAEFFVRDKLIVPGDPAGTAARIAAHPMLWRWGGVADAFAATGDIVLAVIFFALLARVSVSVALLAAAFRLVHVGMLAVGTALQFAAQSYLGMKGVAPAVLQDAAYTVLRLRAISFNVALLFFGFACVALAYLFWRSRLVPRFIGAWLGLAGVGYLVNFAVHFIAPAYGAAAFQYVTVPCGLGELLLAVWLLVFGVDVERVRRPLPVLREQLS